jgi:hypothetical protein
MLEVGRAAREKVVRGYASRLACNALYDMRAESSQELVPDCLVYVERSAESLVSGLADNISCSNRRRTLNRTYLSSQTFNVATSRSRFQRCVPSAYPIDHHSASEERRTPCVGLPQAPLLFSVRKHDVPLASTLPSGACLIFPTNARSRHTFLTPTLLPKSIPNIF